MQTTTKNDINHNNNSNNNNNNFLIIEFLIIIIMNTNINSTQNTKSLRIAVGAEDSRRLYNNNNNNNNNKHKNKNNNDVMTDDSYRVGNYDLPSLCLVTVFLIITIWLWSS